MKKNNNSIFYRLPARYTLAFLAMAGSVSVAMADGKISMDGFSLNPGETITVPVNLEQDGDVVNLQASIVLPEGLTLVDSKQNEDRVTPGYHNFLTTQSGNTHNFFILSTNFDPIYGNEGMLFELTLVADSRYKGDDILVTNIEISTELEDKRQDEFLVNVSSEIFNIGVFSASTDCIKFTEDVNSYVVEFSLENDIRINGLQATISLPQGLTIKKDERNRYVFNKGSRVTKNASFSYSPITGIVTISDITSIDPWGHSGMLFSFEVEADKSALVKTSEITVKDFIASSPDTNDAIKNNQVLKVTVDNSAYIDGCYDRFLTGIDALLQECDDAIQTINDSYKDVADTYVPQLETVKSELDAEKTRIRQGLDENKMPSEVQPDLEAFDERVGAILTAAKAAQSDIIYAAYEKRVAELQQSYADTESYINTSLTDVAQNYAEQLESIAKNIASFSNIMATAKAAGKPAMELQFGEEEFAAVDKQLEDLLAEANTAQSDHLYGEFDTKLANLTTALADTKEALNNYPNVKANFADRITQIETDLNNAKEIVEENKGLGTLAMVLTSVKEALESMDAALIRILEDASAAESEYLYGEFDTKLANLTTALADTKEALDSYTDVKADYADRVAAVETGIAEVTAFIQQSKADGVNAMDLTSAKEAIQNMDDELARIVVEARTAQSDIIYAAYEVRLNELQENYNYTKTFIDTYLPDVAKDEALVSELASIAQNIADFTNVLKEAQTAGQPAMELQFGMTDFDFVDVQLEDLLVNAKAAQSTITYAAYEAKVAELQQSYETTESYINSLPESVAAEFTAELASIGENINFLTEELAAAKAVGTLAMELQFGMDDFEIVAGQLEVLRENAEQAMAAYYIPGDADGDAVVDVNDFAKVKLHILESHLIEDVLRLKAADANGDGRIDVGDLTTIVDLILNPAQAAAPAAAPAVATNDGLAIVVEGEGMRQRIGIMLNAEQAYAACQMDIRLPEGVTLAQETAGEMAGELTLDSNDLENGLHRILLSSMKGASMNAGNGALLWLDVNVDHSYNGEPIAVSDVLFANAKGQTFALSVAGGNTTGLSNVSMTQEVKEKIYNVGGILMDGLKRGVNIIRGNDGSSKKVIVK